MQVTETGSVRVDLVGGTLDIEPINLIIPNVYTLNVATSLKAKVEVIKTSGPIKIESLDYNKTYEFSEVTDDLLYKEYAYNEMNFIMQLLDYFDLREGVHLKLSSGAPAGSGLGGSSAMGVTLVKALSKFTERKLSRTQMIQITKSTESRILNQGMPGYQDYFPALYGGVLALWGEPGEVKCDQLYSESLINFLEKNITLVYSGVSRNSGINNWDVYKRFFDKDPSAQKGLREIADISEETYKQIKSERFDSLLNLIGREGEARKLLAPGIVPEVIDSVFKKLSEKKLVTGMKMCGAGGGGCFILTHESSLRDEVQKEIKAEGMDVLEFKIERPIND